MTKILIVDDDETICSILKELLERYKFQVKLAYNAWSALEILQEENFDVVVVDLLLTGMNGIDLLSTIKRTSPNTVVIIITAYGSIPSAVEAIKKGASDYICKPFRVEDLVIAIKRALAEAKSKSLNEHIFSCLSHELRRKILVLLAEKRSLKFSELVKILQVDDPPRLSFHLRVLKKMGLITQDESKSYRVTAFGIEVVKLLCYKS
ncbi:MAG: response regulator [Nitrososphaerota archaeon]|nr:response regulator [Candidatus Geocrenenecus dongiae]